MPYIVFYDNVYILRAHCKVIKSDRLLTPVTSHSRPSGVNIGHGSAAVHYFIIIRSRLAACELHLRAGITGAAHCPRRKGRDGSILCLNKSTGVISQLCIIVYSAVILLIEQIQFCTGA